MRKSLGDCLSGQIAEAVAIMMSPDMPLLNGKCEYLSNCITRVTVNEDDLEKKRREAREEFEGKEGLEKN